jgi:hypothetical protein
MIRRLEELEEQQNFFKNIPKHNQLIILYLWNIFCFYMSIILYCFT